ncbi:MAG: proline--tRNA ligase [Bacteroidia bacterium]
MDIKKVKRSEDYSAWYNNLVKNADLAENSDVKGCMVIKPYGYAIWERMQSELDRRFKATGHQNAYFPLFIPKSFFSKEASHVDGFAKECAVVSHYRLKVDEDTKQIVVDPEAKLEEELIVRPTSETIIWNTYRNWIQSYRDLPILLNQWANVVRWEMRTRLFLRTTEFLWQEGHTAHATADEAITETKQMLEVYADFAENVLAVPVVKGVKTANERFAGAIDTYCIEGLMQDGKALQMGTSHFLGQNFAKAFDVKFLNKENKQDYVWATSWGVSTRLMGALIMSHSDDDGLILPPRLAPTQVVIIPIYRKDDEKVAVNEAAERIKKELFDKNITAKIDNREHLSPGFKYADHELKGIPVRIAIGPRDIQNNSVEVARRDTKEKQSMSMVDLANKIEHLLEAIQQNLYQRALDFRDNNITAVNSWEEFKQVLENKGGFIAAHWDGTTETEVKIKEETKATIRCITLNNQHEDGKCVFTGKPSSQRVLFAKAY